MSIVTGPYTMPAAFVRAEDVIGPRRLWNAVNGLQGKFLDVHQVCREQVGDVPEIVSMASWDYQEINRFLRERGFSIQLRPFNPDTFGVAAILKVLLKWLHKGVKATIVAPSRAEYPAVFMKESAGAAMYSVSGHTNPVIALPTQTEDVVILSMLDQAPEDEFEVVSVARHFLAKLQSRGAVEVTFPMVDLDIQADLSWLIGLWTSRAGQRSTVSQAVRQTKVQMNEKGVKVEDAFAAGITLECMMSVRSHTIDRPFLMVISRPGLKVPLFAGYITEDHWKNPGDFSIKVKIKAKAK